MRFFVVFFLASSLLSSALAEKTTDLAKSLNNAFAAVYEKISPSVIIVEVPRRSHIPLALGGYLDETDPLQGSGFILSSDGFLATNYHVIAEGDSSQISVLLFDGRRFPASLVAKDEKTDLAVLQIESSGLPAAELGDSDLLRIGEFAFAIGAPLDLPFTFTFGIISAKGRSGLTRSVAYENYLQTDAAINPGNSGGPLCDIEGRVIGINTLVGHSSQGLGFAIPVNTVKDICAQLISSGRVRRPWLGIQIEGIEENPRLKLRYAKIARGVVVESIIPDSPAAHSKLLPGDVITHIDGKETRKAGDVQQAVLAKKIGDSIRISFLRNQIAWEISITTSELPFSPPPPEPSPAPSSDEAPSLASSLGLRLRTLTPKLIRSLNLDEMTASGIIVTEVLPRSESAAADLRPGDVITAIDNSPVTTETDFYSLLSRPTSETTWQISLIRSGKQAFLYLKKPTPTP